MIHQSAQNGCQNLVALNTSLTELNLYLIRNRFLKYELPRAHLETRVNSGSSRAGHRMLVALPQDMEQSLAEY
jgi:hypothetical protein